MGEEAEPRATVLIPSYNHARFVVGAVQSALDQTEPGIEILVIDDGSSDDSVARLAAIDDPRVLVLTQANAGLSNTLNRGLALARARWVKFLPSDDMMAPRCLEKQLALVEAEPALTAVFCLPEVIDAEGRPLADPGPQAWFDTEARTETEILPGLVERNYLCAPGALFDAKLARDVGGFDADLVVAQDYDLWLRLLPRGRARLLAERLVRVRWHGANQSAVATSSTEAERARALTRALELHGLERWIAACAPHAAPGEPDGRLALARALDRSGLAEVEPLARRLRAEASASASAAGEPPPTRSPVRDRTVEPYLTSSVVADPGSASSGPAPARALALPLPRGGLGGALLRRLRAVLRGGEQVGAVEQGAVEPGMVRPRAVRQGAVKPGTELGTAKPGTLSAAPIMPGPRVEHWVVLAPEPLGATVRARGLAEALARRGHRVTCVARTVVGRPVVARSVAPGPFATLEWSASGIRALLAGSDERLRLLIEAPDAEATALAREARGAGARVVYDRAAAWERSGAPWYHVENERFLVESSDDLVAAERALVPWLAAGRRPVHLLPSPAEDDEARARAAWDAHAGSLEQLASRPTVVVLFACRDDAARLPATLDALLAGRGPGGGSARLVAIDARSSDGSLALLEARQAAGELTVLRSARESLVAARALGLRATASEIVAFVECGAVPLDADWIEGAIAVLLAQRDVGVVAAPGRVANASGSPGRVDVAEPGATTSGDGVAVAVAAPYGAPLVVTRAALRSAGGLNEALPSLARADRDLCDRLRDAGYRLALLAPTR